MPSSKEKRQAAIRFKNEHNLALSVPGAIVLSNEAMAKKLIKAQDAFTYKSYSHSDSSAYSNFCKAYAELEMDDSFIDVYTTIISMSKKEILNMGHDARFYTINIKFKGPVKDREVAICEMYGFMENITKTLTSCVWQVEAHEKKNGLFDVHAHIVAKKGEIEYHKKHMPNWQSVSVRMSTNTKCFINSDGKYIDLDSSAQRMSNYLFKPFMTMDNGAKKKACVKDSSVYKKFDLYSKALKMGATSYKEIMLFVCKGFAKLREYVNILRASIKRPSSAKKCENTFENSYSYRLNVLFNRIVRKIT